MKIQSAVWATADKLAAIVQTEESGAVVISLADTPGDWESFSAWIDAGGDVDDMPSPLEEFRATKLAQIDREAEAERLKYITPGDGQSMTYMRKANQARALANAATPANLSLYPAVVNEIGLSAPDTGNPEADARAVAASILAREDSWGPISDVIEKARLSAKRAVEAASTVAEIEAVNFSMGA